MRCDGCPAAVFAEVGFRAGAALRAVCADATPREFFPLQPCDVARCPGAVAGAPLVQCLVAVAGSPARGPRGADAAAGAGRACDDAGRGGDHGWKWRSGGWLDALCRALYYIYYRYVRRAAGPHVADGAAGAGRRAR